MSPSISGSPTRRERFVDLSTGRYRSLRWGEPTDPPVVLLHGRTSLAETWDAVGEALADDGWYALALEQRGHGGSPWQPEGHYDLAHFVGDLVDFVDQEGLDSFALVGHSMGSCTSLAYAGRHSERLAALVLEDGGPLGPTVEAAVDEDRDSSPRSFPTWRDAYQHIARGHPHLTGHELERRVDLTVRPGRGGRYHWKADHHELLSDRHLDETFDSTLWEAAASLSVDTMFLWAKAPYLVEPEVVEKMVTMNPRIRKVTVASGHSIHEERLDLFLEAVLPFLRERKRAR